MSTDIKMADSGASSDPSLINNHVHSGYTNGPNQSPPNGLPVVQTHTLLPHGYGQAQPVQNDAHIDPELRSAQEVGANPVYPAPPNMMPAAVPSHPDQAAAAMSGPSSSPTGVYSEPGVDGGSDGRKQKRELSQSKRAAQNRAAQRAFRQRKEGYIKKLEQQVKEADEARTSYQSLQAENEHLRMYIIDLQSRLIDLQGNYPPPPTSVNLAHPRAVALPAPTPHPAYSGPTTSSLAAVAQAVEGMTSDGCEDRDDRADGAHEADEISRQLKAEPPEGL